MTDDKKNIDETLKNMGFSTMSEEEQKKLDSARDQKAKTPPKRHGVSDEEAAALRVRIKAVLDDLPHPMETDIWITEVSELQSQLRSCLNNEIYDRWVDFKRHKLFKVFMRGNGEEDEQMALMFPISMALLVYNALYDPEAVKDDDPFEIPNLLEGTAFERQEFFQLVEQVIKPDKFTCENVHPFVAEFLDDVNLSAVAPLVTPEQYTVAEILAREVLIRIYAEVIAFMFKPRIRNAEILKMLTTVIILTFAANKHVTTAMSDML